MYGHKAPQGMVPLSWKNIAADLIHMQQLKLKGKDYMWGNEN